MQLVPQKEVDFVQPFADLAWAPPVLRAHPDCPHCEIRQLCPRLGVIVKERIKAPEAVR